MSRWIPLLIFVMVPLVGHAFEGPDTLKALDSDFFGPQFEESKPLSAFTPGFFSSGQGLLAKAPPGAYGCMPVTVSSPAAASRALGLLLQKYCAKDVKIHWIPPAAPNNQAQKSVLQSLTPPKDPQGYYQVCCVKKLETSRRTRRYTLPAP